MIDSFEKSTKPTFKDPSDRSFIKFGSMRDRDPDFGIRSGQLTLEGCAMLLCPHCRIRSRIIPVCSAEVAGFFEPSIAAITDAVRGQRSAASETVKASL